MVSFRSQVQPIRMRTDRCNLYQQQMTNVAQKRLLSRQNILTILRAAVMLLIKSMHCYYKLNTHVKRVVYSKKTLLKLLGK